jgi:hypothetical protein
MSGGSTVGVAKSKPTNEWPAYLNKDVLSVIHNDLKFNSMTPVQVSRIEIRNSVIL